MVMTTNTPSSEWAAKEAARLSPCEWKYGATHDCVCRGCKLRPAIADALARQREEVEALQASDSRHFKQWVEANLKADRETERADLAEKQVVVLREAIEEARAIVNEQACQLGWVERGADTTWDEQVDEWSKRADAFLKRAALSNPDAGKGGGR